MALATNAAATRARIAACAAVTCALAPACKEQDPGPDLQIVGETSRLRTTDPVPRQSPWFDGTSIELTAARGETLGFLVLHRDSQPVTVELSGTAVRTYAVEPAVARRASTKGLYGGSRGTGVYPDVLVATAAPTTNPAYIEIDIARDAQPGPRSGRVTIGSRAIDLRLDVVTAQLPASAPRVWAYYDPRELVWAGLGAGTHDAPSAEERACIAMFRDYGVMLTPDLPISAWPARRELLAGFPFIPTKLPKDPALAAADVRAWIEATRGTNQLPFSIPIDEPRKREARAKVRELATAVRAAGGGPETFLYAVTAEPHEDFGDLIDLYITLRAKRSDTFPRWTYNGAPPRAGSFVLDAKAPGPRTWGWIGWRWRIPVWYVWDALYWHDRHNRKGAALPGRAFELAKDATSFDDGEDHGNLDGVLALPGDARTPCRPTLRLAAIRRAMQDRALIELAATCNAIATEQLVAKMVPRALGDAKSSPTWPRDEAAWETARRELLTLASCATR